MLRHSSCLNVVRIHTPVGWQMSILAWHIICTKADAAIAPKAV